MVWRKEPAGPALLRLSSRVHVEGIDDHQHVTSIAPLYQILFIGVKPFGVQLSSQTSPQYSIHYEAHNIIIYHHILVSAEQ